MRSFDGTVSFVGSLLTAATLVAACSGSPAAPPDQKDGSTYPPGTFCARGKDVPGVTPAQGFCLREYARVGEARSLALAPNGDLFVGAPSTSTSGGASGGPGAVVVLSDDDLDGVAESSVFTADKVPDVHAVTVGGGYVYFTTKAEVFRMPYAPGQRKETPGTREGLGLPATYGGGGRWTHGLARSVGGQLVTSRGEYAQCTTTALGGDVSTIGDQGALTVIASGFRNPMYVRCHAKDEVCAAMELGEDTRPGAREKMVMLKTGAAPNYGFPCCFTTDKKASDNATMCGEVTKEDAEFPLAETPFGFDWEPGVWGAPYTGAVFVALHGSAYSSPAWQGTRIVYAAVDAATHAPIQEWQDFQLGFGVGGTVLERPSDVTFAPSGVMYFADDHAGRVYWMAPADLAAPN
jgi:glucose/arabinose dehydrogenase